MTDRGSPWTRASALPLAAIGILLAGGALWLWGRAFQSPDAALLGGRVWYVGLLVTGAPVVWRTLRQALHGHFATDMVAMLAIIGAVLLREPLAGLVIVLMQSGGEALERYAEGRASAAVRELEAAAPRIAHRAREGRVEDLAAEDVLLNDILLIRPGEMVPCDAVVVEGRSPVDASRLTCEPLPVDAAPGTKLLSGSVNGDAPLTVRATAVARDSLYARIVELVRSAQATKAPIQRLADRYAVWFTPLTLLVCAGTWFWSGDATRVLAVLVVATPCPLILATPIAIIGGINRAARRQIVVRNGVALEQLGGIRTVIFDKTGTLTIGRPEVQRVVALDGWSERDLLRAAGAVEQGAGHLLARSLVAAAEGRLAADGEHLPGATAVVEAAGQGVTGTVEGRRVTVGALAFVVEREPLAAAALSAADAKMAAEPGLRAFVAVDGAAAGVVEYADRIRDDAHAVIGALRDMGIRRLVLLSGDNAANVEWVADKLGLPEARANLLPQDKVAFIRDLVATGEHVLMMGDGTNDAPAMSSATVGVALAAHGGGITAEAADVVLLADDLGRLPEAVGISRRALHIARQSIVVGLGLSAVAMVFAMLGAIPPTVGALIQEGIDVAVIMNALRSSR